MTSKVQRSSGKKPPNAGKGRPAGVPNRTTAALKEAILLAAEQHGRDGKGKDGLDGFLGHLARIDVKAFTSLLSKLLPTNIKGELDLEPKSYVVTKPDNLTTVAEWNAWWEKNGSAMNRPHAVLPAVLSMEAWQAKYSQRND